VPDRLEPLEPVGRFPVRTCMELLGHRKHSLPSQTSVAIVVSLVTFLAACCLAKQALLDTSVRSPTLLGIVSAIFFGVDNFLIEYASAYLHAPTAHLALMFPMLGVIALATHVLLAYLNPEYKSEWAETMRVLKSSNSTLLHISLTGVFIALAQLCGSISFSADQVNAGPNQAIVSASGLLVGLFFYFYSGDTFTSAQLMGCGLIVIGAWIMSTVGSYRHHDASKDAFLWMCLATIFYSASAITLRLWGTNMYTVHQHRKSAPPGQQSF
jgi:drug/metabolite transporter (DMT)-like permease